MERRLQELRDYRVELESRLNKLNSVDYEKQYRDQISELNHELDRIKLQREKQGQDFEASS